MGTLKWIKANLYVMGVLAVTLAFVVAMLTLLANSGRPPVHIDPAPTFTVYAGPAVPLDTDEPAEDDPGWDCRARGNHVCVIGTDRWLNLDHLPVDDPYELCVLLLGAPDVLETWPGFASYELCESIGRQRG